MPPEKQKKEPRLSNGTIGLMVGFAVGADILGGLIGLIPFVGWVINVGIDFFVFGMLWLWFTRHRVSFTGTRAFVFAGFALLEFIPGIQEFPLWILDVVAVCIMVRLEDKLHLTSVQQKLQAGKKIGVLMAKNKRIGALMDSTEKGKQIRQQILQSQRQSLAQKKSSGEGTQEKTKETPKQLPKNETIDKPNPIIPPKKETPAQLPQIGTNARFPTPEA
ncbi:MAG: hypothetical protein WCV55_03505 [Candidatus Paceibacterota bacterium]